MGMKCNFIVASRGDAAARLRDLPPLDVAASDALATEILGKRSWGRRRRSHRTGDLVRDVYPRDGEIAVAVYGDLIIAAYEDVSVEWTMEAVPDWGYPILKDHDVDAFVLHSVVSMGVFAFWRNDETVRVFGGADRELFVDEGTPLPFEHGFDAEEDTYGSLTERAIFDRLGYSYEGPRSADGFDPASVPLLVYR
ncbi:DUF6928 family protein [Tsukamurella pulmonis]|uniref:DUF6928 family protein n=1 Tax=Tsukamurella pulmonis TaxID=47312 RepID=UPI0009E99D73|nr:hypothetical protein [Tsukamurella pulmonis]RDH10813.1 hypothetical protein DVB88_16100 [Tsukamurella pulmonis]